MRFEYQIIDGYTKQATGYVARSGNEFLLFSNTGVVVRFGVKQFEAQIDLLESQAFYLAELTEQEIEEKRLYPLI